MRKSHFIQLIEIIFLLNSQVTAQVFSIEEFNKYIRIPELNRFRGISNTYQYESNPDQLNFDAVSYELNIEIFPDLEEINGHVKIKGKSLENGLQQVDINLYDNMQIDSIKQGSAELLYSRSNNIVTVQLETSLNYGDNFLIEFYYQGNPANGDPERWLWETQPGTTVPVIYSLSSPYGASTWWPCKDNLGDKADTVSIRITVPNDLVVASNGILENVIQTGSRSTYCWKTEYPIAAYLVSVAVSDYAIFSDEYISSSQDTMVCLYYVYPDLINEARIDFSNIPDMIAFYASKFGEYPFFNEKYGIALTPFFGALENQTMVSYSNEFIDGTHFWDFVLAHELSHHWFGDCVTMGSWAHVWLSEGFATYCQALWEEHNNGLQAYLQEMARFDYGNFQGSVFVTDTTNFSALFSGTVYYKGAWVLHMLRKVIGDDNFFNSLFNFANEPVFKYHSALTEDFKLICETESDMNLEWFFNQWIYWEGRPEYICSWTKEGIGPYETTLIIEQSNTQLYKMPLEIKLYNEQYDTLITVWDSLQVQQFNFTTNFNPTYYKVDPQGWVLKKVTYLPASVVPNEDNFENKFSLNQNYPNPFNPSTIIRYQVDQIGFVSLKVYDVLGNEIATLVNEEKPAGRYKVEFKGNGLPSGIYFYRLQAGSFIDTRKMILLK